MSNALDKRKEAQLADRGWQAMQAALDREMPEERKRRRLVWWWFAALLLLPLLSWGGYALWQGSGTQPLAPTPAQPHRPLPAAQPSVPVVQSPDKQQHKHKNETFPAQGQATRTAKHAALDPSVGTRPSPSQQQPNPQAEFAAALLTERVVTALPAAAALAQPMPSPENPALPSTQPPALAFERPYPVATPLPSGIHPLPPVPQILPSVPNPALPALATKPATKVLSVARFRIGATAAVGTERFEALNSWSAGLSADVRLLKKWGLRSGLQYAQYRPGMDAQPLVPVQQVEYSQKTGVDLTGVLAPPIQNADNSPSDYVFIPLTQLRQLEMPLLAWWQPRKSWRLFAGTVAAYTLAGRSADQNFVENGAFNLSTNGGRQLVQDASQLAVGKLPRWQWAAQTGLGFAPHRRMEVALFWRKPLPHASFFQRSELEQVANPNVFPTYDPTLTSTAGELPAAGRWVLQASWFF
jgi:hypothetical protein